MGFLHCAFGTSIRKADHNYPPSIQNRCRIMPLKNPHALNHTRHHHHHTSPGNYRPLSLKPLSPYHSIEKQSTNHNLTKATITQDSTGAE